ncbi:hypothetical protein BAT_1289 [Bacillus pumilus ATCC 7061]|nr:hypothetical protein BAT_1289 [Bacillus pumilus ATCC 7061]
MTSSWLQKELQSAFFMKRLMHAIFSCICYDRKRRDDSNGDNEHR